MDECKENILEAKVASFCMFRVSNTMMEADYNKVDLATAAYLNQKVKHSNMLLRNAKRSICRVCSMLCNSVLPDQFSVIQHSSVW